MWFLQLSSQCEEFSEVPALVAPCSLPIQLIPRRLSNEINTGAKRVAVGGEGGGLCGALKIRKKLLVTVTVISNLVEAHRVRGGGSKKVLEAAPW